MFRYALILGVIAALSAAVLAFTYELTKGPIAEETRKDFLAGLLVVLPEGFDNEPDQDTIDVEGTKAYIARKNGDYLGFAIQTSSRKGYSGEISVLVGISNNEIYNVTVIKHSETPGLGDKITNPEWLASFKGAAMDKVLKVKPDGGDIDGFSGATISPRAVCEAVTQAQGLYKAMFAE